MIRAEPSRRSGFSLLELLVVMAILALTMAVGLPRFTLATEQARVDRAASRLRTIWLGQRMHWAETRRFADSLAELSSQRFTDVALEQPGDGFLLAVEQADVDTFEASAIRVGSSTWSGTLAIDQDGQLTGSVTNGQGDVITPAID